MAVLGGALLAGCSQDHSVSPNTPIGQQIESAYPSATDLMSHYNDKNFDKGNTSMTWNMPDGRRCKAQSSTVHWNGDVPKSLVGPVMCTPPSPTGRPVPSPS